MRLAADRGVRVRVLVDDLNTAGEDRRFMHLASMRMSRSGYSIRSPAADPPCWTRFLASVSDIPRINHRMHNKLFVADNAIAITGGRNIGDEYFTRDPHSNFIDLDVVAAGADRAAAVRVLRRVLEQQVRLSDSLAGLARGGRSRRRRRSRRASRAGEANWLARELDADALQLNWVPATVLADRPGKIAQRRAARRRGDDRQGH